MIVVHDLDGDGNRKTINSFDEAFEIGKQVDIFVYYSIPSFEYWLLLHNDFLDANLTREVCADKVKNYVNAKRKEKGQARLHGEKHKTEPGLFFCFGGIDGANRARENATKRWSNGYPPKKPSDVRPSTNFYLLLDALKDFSDKQKCLKDHLFD